MAYHFISGLPRAGSTLLAAILRQNRRFHAGIQSPLGQCVASLRKNTAGDNESHWFINDHQRVRMFRSLFSAFYADIDADVIFDSNRLWCANISLLLELFPDAYVLCCVRDPVAIVDSIERLLQKHPTRLSTIIGLEQGATVYRRVDMIMNPATGVVGYSLNATKEAYYGLHGDRLLLVKYDDLARDPMLTLEQIHDKLGLPEFEYDFDAIEDIPGSDVFDEALGTPGLHSLKKKVIFEPRTSILPPDIFNNLPTAFWS